MTFLVLFIVLFIMLTIGVPVGFAIGGATMISMYFCSNLNMVVNAQYGNSFLYVSRVNNVYWWNC